MANNDKTLTLTIAPRAKMGTTATRRLRAAGKVPAVLYGHGAPAEHVAFDARAFEELLHRGGRTGLVTLEGAGTHATALLRDVQRDPVTQRIIHADLQRVSATEAVHARLRVVTVGVARGVKEFGGVMDVIAHEIEVEGPANELPDHLEVDVSPLGLHEHASAGDVALPAGFKLVTPAETLVVAIESSRTAQLVEEAAAAGAPEQPVPESIKPEAAPEAEA